MLDKPYSKNISRFLVQAARDLHEYDVQISHTYGNNFVCKVGKIDFYIYSLPIDHITRRKMWDIIQNRRNKLYNRRIGNV